MSTVATSTKEAALAARVLEALRGSGSMGWDTSSAVAALEALPYPTTRLERWKYTRVAGLLDLEVNGPAPEENTPEAPLPGLEAIRLTFSGGRFTGDIIDEGAHGCFIGPVSEAYARYPERVMRLVNMGFAQQEWFAALHAAAPQDGACVLVPEGRVLDLPVLVHCHTGEGNRVAQPLHLMDIGMGAQAEAILWFDSPPRAAGLLNTAFHAMVGDRGRFAVEIVQDERGTHHHIGHLHCVQGHDSTLDVRTATARAQWLRNDLHIAQNGAGASSTFHGCYLPNGQQFVDHHTRIDHACPDGRSDELYKGLAADRATAVFNGKIMVHKDAQRIEAYQSNANLLLGEQAAMYSKPELEIYADDVRCSHGCTTGQFDSEALFYLRSRGMTETAAHNLLVQAFLAEVLDGFRPEIRAHVHDVYAQRLGWS